ncbi:MAG TPA: cyclin, partial [Gammaproteobacteria bacterium]|nr:cyclin [Gammaproteobacteria bacterium]
IRTHLTGSVAAFIYMAIFVDLYLARTNDYLHPYNAHRLIFTSFVVADKFVHEKSDSYLNTWLAKVGNVSLKELNKMEQELCAVLFQWTKEKKTLSGNPDVLDEYDYVHREEPPFDWSLMYEEWHKKYFPKRGLDLMPNTDCQSTTFSIRKKLDITEDPFVIKPVNEVKDNEIKPVDEVKDNEAPVKPKLVEAIARFYAKKMDEDKDKLPFISEFTYFSEGGCPSIEDYLKRFLHLERISVKAFLHMTLMMDTWFRNHSDQPFGIENCYCLMAASLCIAHKFHDGGFDGKNYILYRENKPFEDGAHRVSEFETEARLPPDHLKKLMLLFQTGINNQLRYTADEYRAAEIRFLAPADRNPVLKELAKFEPQTQKPFLEAFHPAVEEPSCPVIFNETPRRPVSFHI